MSTKTPDKRVSTQEFTCKLCGVSKETQTEYEHHISQCSPPIASHTTSQSIKEIDELRKYPETIQRSILWSRRPPRTQCECSGVTTFRQASRWARRNHRPLRQQCGTKHGRHGSG